MSAFDGRNYCRRSTPVTRYPDRSAVRQLLAAYLYAGRPPRLADIAVYGPVYSGYNSRVFRVNSSKLPFPCALKLCLMPRSAEQDPDTARQQFETLTRVAGVLPKDGRYSVPQPYLLMEAHGALLTQWVEGKTLSGILLAFGRGQQYAKELLEGAAGWLRTFHAARPRTPGKLDLTAKISNLDELQRRGLPRPRLLNRCRNLLIDSAEHASSVESPQAWLCGDFKSDNLIFARSNVFGLDIDALNNGSVLYDAASFLNHLDLKLRLWAQTRLWFCKDGLFRHFVASYFEGTGIDYSQVALPLNWIRLYMLLSAWSTVHARMGGSVRGMFLQQQYAAAAANVANGLERMFRLPALAAV